MSGEHGVDELMTMMRDAVMMGRYTRLKPLTFRIGPVGVEALLDMVPNVPDERRNSIDHLMGVSIVTDPRMVGAGWELREGDEVVKSGSLCGFVPDGMVVVGYRKGMGFVVVSDEIAGEWAVDRGE